MRKIKELKNKRFEKVVPNSFKPGDIIYSKEYNRDTGDYDIYIPYLITNDIFETGFICARLKDGYREFYISNSNSEFWHYFIE